MERELELATEIQQRFQPSASSDSGGYEFQGISFSCYEIGGDYYDFIPQPGGKMLIALGDVSGKGTAAALLMSSLHASIHAQSVAQSSLKASVEAINLYLAENTPTNRFITLFIAELDPNTGIWNTSTPDIILRWSDERMGPWNSLNPAVFHLELSRCRIRSRADSACSW